MIDDDNTVKLTIGKNCKLEFSKDGNLKIGEGCNGTVINPAEIQLLDRVNQDNEAK